jgi:large subunit ribosomal protein L21
VVRIEKLDAEPGTDVEFTEVLMTSREGSVRVGNPNVSGARVTAQVIDQLRAKKILVFKKKRRKNYRRHQGHRQYLTAVRVTGIDMGASDGA